MPSRVFTEGIGHTNETVSATVDSSGNLVMAKDIKLPAAGGIKDSSGNNLLTEAGSAVTLSDKVIPANSFMFRNKVINGSMRIDQRNSGSAVTTANSFPVDRFSCLHITDGAFSAQQDSSAPSGFTNSIKWTTTTADTSLAATQHAMVIQRIEGNNIYDLGFGTASAKTITLSFWVKSSLTGTFGGSLMNGGQTRCYPYSYTISTADTWEHKSITIPGDTDTSITWLTTNGKGFEVFWSMGVGSDYDGTAGAWTSTPYQYSVTGAVSVMGTLNANWYITGVQLEVGSSATPFEHRPAGVELGLCQRYYQKSYDLSEKPGGATQYPTHGTHLGTYQGSEYVYSIFNSTYNQRLNTNIPLKTRMRSAAGQTLKIYNPYNGDLNNVMQTGGGSSYATTIQAYSETSPSFYATVTGNTYGNSVGDIYVYHWVVENEL